MPRYTHHLELYSPHLCYTKTMNKHRFERKMVRLMAIAGLRSSYFSLFAQLFIIEVLQAGVQGDVVHLDWPITNSAFVYEPKCGGGGEWRGLGQWVQLYTGAQINFGDLTPYSTYDSRLKLRTVNFNSLVAITLNGTWVMNRMRIPWPGTAECWWLIRFFKLLKG